jgi:HK97 family phage major capsid protein
MSGANDAMLAKLTAEIEEKRAFQERLVEDAQAADDGKGRDLTANEMELYQRASSRMGDLEAQIEPLREAARIAALSNRRTAELAEQFSAARNPNQPGPVEYRSASGYALDRWKAALGNDDAKSRLDIYERAAAHQTTGDNPGIIPSNLIEPILNYVDVARPIVGAIGPQNLSGSGYISRVTQHTQVAKQTAEKTELASRKMTITKTAIDAATFGGYVNVSRQNVDWSSPNALDVVINDLAGQYAIETEEETADVLWAGGTSGPIIPAAATSEEVAQALWTAAGQAYTAMQGLGRLILAVSPDMLGLIGPMFAPINPTNAQGSGFAAGSFASGMNGVISGISVVMSAGLDTGQAVVINTAAASVYEDRVGALQVVEPSVLGVQVAYAGYFKALILSAGGVIKITVGP